MLLSSQTDFNYDDQTSSSSSGPPAGDGGSGRGYRNTITDAVSGFIGLIRGGDGLGRNDSERRNNYPRRNHNERHNDNWDRETLRDNLRHIAIETLEICDDGEYFPPGQDGPYDLRAKIEWTDENTRYYGPDAGEGGEILESEFIKINEEGGDEGKEEKEEVRNKGGDTDAGEEVNEKQGENESEKATASAASKPHDDDNANPKDHTRVHTTVSPDPPKKATLDNSRTTIYVGEYSTLVGARKVYLALARNTDPSFNKKIGVLNFASAKKPGGGFINGAQAQEESLARTSTLYPSLSSEAASEFYTLHREDPGNAYYSHAMVYSPGIVLMRDDQGEWRSPVEVDVLTSAAVNAGEIRRGLEREERLRIERVEMEYWKRKGEERRKQSERIFAERQRLREEARKKKVKEELAKLKKEQAKSKKKEMVKEKGTDKGKAKESGGEKEEPIDKQEKAAAEVEIENEENEGEDVEVEKQGKAKESGVEKEESIDKPEKAAAEVEIENEEKEKGEGVEVEKQGKAKESGGEREEPFDKQEKVVADVENEEGEEVEVEKTEENQENTTDSPDNGLEDGSDSQRNGAEENTEFLQDDQPQPEVPPEFNQEHTSSVVHPPSPPTKPSQAPVPDPNLTYARSLKNAEFQIEQTMYDRISRILHLFQLHQIPHLILGSFGTGVFKNRTDLIADIFADLLIKPGARFKDVFKTVVFAILGKDTVRVFSGIFLKAEKRAQRERTGKMRVFVDSFGGEGDGDVKEGYEEKAIRMMMWKARRRELRNPFMNVIPDEAPIATPFDLAQLDAGFPPLSFGAAQDSAFSNPTSSAAADAASSSNAFQAGAAAYAASSNAFRASRAAFAAPSNPAQASVASYPPFFDATPSFDATNASETTYPTSFTASHQPADASVQANPTAYAAPSNPAQDSVASYPPFFDATPSFEVSKASEIPYPTSTAAHQPADASVQANPTAVDYNGIPEDAEMILTRDDEKVDFVAEVTPNAPITPKDMVVDDGKDIETIETNSLPTCSHEALSNKKEDDGDIEMQ